MKLNYYIYSLIASVMLIFSACSPDEYDLGDKGVTSDDLVEGIAYTITHDSKNPNIVYLKSKLGVNYTALWEHPQGRSQEQKVTLKMPFEGTYTVKFGVETRGGVIYGEPTTFDISTFCADFVNDELWSFLTGGVDSEKVWIFDDGSYGYAAGEMTYADPSKTTEWNNWEANWDPGKGHTGDDAIWASTMTFDLKGGANVNVHSESVSGTTDSKGTFMLNTENHTITFTDCDLLHTPGWTDRSTNWRKDLKILELDENHLRVAVMRDNSEGAWWLIWNFVSKEFADNYVPEDQPDPEPTLPDGWKDAVSQTVSTTIQWNMSADVPFDWANLDGSLMNNFTAGNYPDWATPVADLDKLSLTMDSKAMTYEFSMPDGTTVSGTYTLDEKGIYSFESGVPSYHIGGGDIMFFANSDNQLRILRLETMAGNVTSMWLGVRNGDKEEYVAYHFIPNAAGGSSTPEPKAVVVDNSKLVFGHLEGEKNNFRIEIYNDFGSTKNDSPVDLSALTFDYSMKLTFSISGLSGDALTKEYNAGLMYTAPGWWPSYSGESDVKIKGDGTYTITYKPEAAINGAIVFVIDIFDIFSDITEPDAVKVTIDNLEIL